MQDESDTDDVNTGLKAKLAHLSLPEAVEAFEKHLIAEKLTQNQGNTSQAAERLGVSQRTLQRKMKRYNL